MLILETLPLETLIESFIATLVLGGIVLGAVKLFDRLMGRSIQASEADERERHRT